MKIESVLIETKYSVFYFIPVFKEIFQGRMYTVWHVIFVTNKGWYQTFYVAFVPSVSICRAIKRNKKYEKI